MGRDNTDDSARAQDPSSRSIPSEVGPSPPYASLDLRKLAIYGRQLLPEPLDLSQQPLGGGRGQRWRHDQ